MKNLLTILLILLPLSAHAWGVMVTSGGVEAGAPAATCLVNQNFEGTGYDNSETWTEYGSGIDPNYTTTALRGSQSLQLVTNYYYTTSPTFTAQANCYARTMLRYPVLPSGTSTVFSMMNGTTVICKFIIQANGRIAAQDGTVINYGGAGTLTEVDTTYYIWLEREKGTGANGITRMYFATTSTKPSASITISTGDSSLDVDRVRIETENGLDPIIDQVIVDDAAIGSGDQP